MNAEQFCYWLQGYFELKQTIDHREGATPETMKMIEEHLQTVFMKVTPAYQPPNIGLPGAIRSSEFRHEDHLRSVIGNPNVTWPLGGAPVITC